MMQSRGRFNSTWWGWSRAAGSIYTAQSQLDSDCRVVSRLIGVVLTHTEVRNEVYFKSSRFLMQVNTPGWITGLTACVAYGHYSIRGIGEQLSYNVHPRKGKWYYSRSPHLTKIRRHSLLRVLPLWEVPGYWQWGVSSLGEKGGSPAF